VVTAAIHRLVEQHAATRPASPAIVDGARALTYRDLNHCANACARNLAAHGFRRGWHAVVRMEPGAGLAIMLLAVLKAGGSYTWIDPRKGVLGEDAAIFVGPTVATRHGDISIDPQQVVVYSPHPSPNLPVLTRGTDIACVLDGAASPSEVLVPHATVVAMQGKPTSPRAAFCDDPGAFDLWIVLMAGGTAMTNGQQPVVAAA
jgi:hypothetical protein